MSPTEAAKLLDLPADATPEQIETRFNELRAKLEDKVAKAPTPGLKAKYRESLEEITTAFEALTLAADASSLPMLQRQRTEDRGQKTAKSAAAVGGVPPPREASPKPAAKKSGGGKEFLTVALIAVAVLGAGGWWVMKTRTENEAKVRLAAEAKAEADRQAQIAKGKAERDAQLAREKTEQEKLAQAATEKAEKEHAEKLFTSLRSRMAELNVAYDALMRADQSAERELAELKSQERDLAREQKAAPTPELRRLSAQVRAQDRLVSWLRDTLPTHPAKVARAKADEFLSARALDEAAPAVADYAQQIYQLKKDIAESRANLAITGTMQLSANLEGATWQLTDAFGVERSGGTPARLDDVALGKGVLTFHRDGWPDQKYPVDLRPGGGIVEGKFPVGMLHVTSEPTGAQMYRGKTMIGTTPLVITEVPPGQFELRLSQRGFRDKKFSVKIEDGMTLNFEAHLEPGHTVDADFILKALPAELAAISNPEERANFIMAVLTVARQLEGVEKSSLQSLMAMHLAACQAIPEPWRRFTALAEPSEFILPSLDFTYSRAWGELAAATLPTITVHGERQAAAIQTAAFSIQPDLQIKMASAMTNWFSGDGDWNYRAQLGQLFAEAGAEAEAQRAFASAMDPSNEFQNEHVGDSVAAGRQARQFLPVRLALIKDDLPAAQRELASYTGRLQYDDFISIAGEFIRLGDADSALRMARQIQIVSIFPTTTTSVLVSAASTAGNYPLAERWAATLTDTAETQTRSQAYLALADTHLTNGRTAEALQAINQVVTFPAAAYAVERYHCALILAQLGETTRARNLIQSSPLAFSKDESTKLCYAAALFAMLGDAASAERALPVIQSASPYSFTFAVNTIVQALGQAGRFEEAKGYRARLNGTALNGTADSSRVSCAIASVQVRRTPDEEWDKLSEQTPAGMPRAAVLYAILALNLDRQNSARFSH